MKSLKQIDNLKSHDKKIVAVIVTYNRLNLLKECLDALFKSDYHTDILVVNNNSNDGTKEYLDDIKNQDMLTKFYVFNLSENLGGAGGFNYGIREASKLDYDRIWIMDDDCIANKNTLSELVKIDELVNGNFGFLSSKVLWTDGTICKTNVQRKRIARKIKDFDSNYVNVDFASFVSLYVKRVDALNVGLPIKEFVIWTDDLEWTRRLTYTKIYEAAKPGFLCNKSIVTHKCANNFGVSIVYDTKERLNRYKYIYRNDVYCFKREGIGGNIFIIFRNLYHIFKVLLLSKTEKLLKIKIIVDGFFDGLRFSPKIEYVNNKME